jgi:hypothetical protein
VRRESVVVSNYPGAGRVPRRVSRRAEYAEATRRAITTEAWTDKQTGDKRTAQRVLAEIVGPCLRGAATRITKTARPSVTTSRRTTSAGVRLDPVGDGVRQDPFRAPSLSPR